MRFLRCAAFLLLAASTESLFSFQNSATPPRTTEEVLFDLPEKNVLQGTGFATRTHDGTHVLWQHFFSRSGSWQFYLDGKPIARFNSVAIVFIKMAPDGQITYFVRAAPNQWNMVVNNEVRATFQVHTIANALFFPGGELAAVEIAPSGNDKWRWEVGGTKNPEFDSIGPLAFSKDYKQYAYIAQKPSRAFLHPMTGRIVINGKEEPEYEPGGPRTYTFHDGVRHVAHLLGVGEPAFSADGRRFGYAVHRDKTDEAVLIDGEFGPAFEAILYGPIFSDDGKHFAYAAGKDKSKTVLEVRDHKVIREINLKENTFFSQAAFSPDLSHFAFVYGKLGFLVPDTVKIRHLFLDGKELAEIECKSIQSLDFTPDGQHLIYQVTLEAGKHLRQYIGMDGQPGKSYDFIVPGSLFYPDGHTAQYIGIEGTKFIRVTTSLD
jgi:hypothetical protein